MSLGDFFLGLLSPFVASGLLVLAARQLSGRGVSGQSSINLAIPLVVLTLALVAAGLLWGSRRWTAYGLLAAVGLALLVSAAWWVTHAASGGTPPPPR